MEITLIYAIAAGGIALGLVLINLLPRLPRSLRFARSLLLRALRYFLYTNIVCRHTFLGPWTLAEVVAQIVFIGSNCICLGLGFPGFDKAGIRAANLALINLIPLLFGSHLGFVADILGVSLRTFRLIHRSAALMLSALVLFHSVVVVVLHTTFTSHTGTGLSAIIVVLSELWAGSSLGLSVVLSWPPLRNRFYEMFIRLHQALALSVAISTLLHISSSLPRLYLYVAFGIFCMSTLGGVGNFLRRNMSFTKTPKIGEIFRYDSDSTGGNRSPVQLTIIPKAPLKMKAGQYISVCIPSLGLRSSVQSHPFVVASWTGKVQTKLEIVIEPLHGWTKRLHARALPVSGYDGGLGRVYFTGPHGVSVPVDDYEYILMIASGYGIVAHLALLERLVQGTLAHEVRARRIRLIWEFEDIGLYRTVYPLLNWVLKEDRKLGENSTLSITLYTEQLTSDDLGQRASILPPPMSITNVFASEVSTFETRQLEEHKAIETMEQKRSTEKEKGRGEIFDEYEKRQQARNESRIDVKLNTFEAKGLPVCTRTPRMLIAVSAVMQIRDEVRAALRTALDQEITLAELEYQPHD